MRRQNFIVAALVGYYLPPVAALSGFWSFGRVGECITIPIIPESEPRTGRFDQHRGYYQSKYQFDLDVETRAVCSVDETLPTVTQPGIYNESIHKAECDSYVSTSDFLDTTPRKFAFHSNQFNALGFVPIIKVYSHVPDTGSRFQFLMSAELHPSDLFIVKAVFGASSEQEEFVIGTLNSSDLPGIAETCFGLNGKWFRYALNTDVVSDAMNTALLDARSFRSIDVGIEIRGAVQMERKVLIDTLQVVRDLNFSAGDTIESSRFQNQLDEIPLPEGTDLADPLTSIFVFVPILVLIAGIIVLCKEELRSDSVLMNRFAVIWFVTSLASLGYACFQTAEFIRIYDTFVEDVQKYSEDLPIALASISPQELEETLPGRTPRGFSALFMPPLSRETWERHFTVPSVADPRIEAICADLADECVANPDVFFSRYSQNSSVSFLVGIVNADQSFFITPIIALLVIDGLATIVSEFFYQMSRRGGKSARYMPAFHCLEGLFMVVSVGLTIFLVVLVGTRTIDFSFDMVLVHEGSFTNSTFKQGLFLTPRSDKQSAGEDGLGQVNLNLDSASDISLCSEALRKDIDASWQAEIKSELFQESRIGTDAETCSLNAVSFPSPQCFSIPCAGTVIPLATSQQSEPQIDFVVNQVLLGVVAIDLALTVTEIVIFFLFSYVKPDSEEDTTKLVT